MHTYVTIQAEFWHILFVEVCEYLDPLYEKYVTVSDNCVHMEPNVSALFNHAHEA